MRDVLEEGSSLSSNLPSNSSKHEPHYINPSIILLIVVACLIISMPGATSLGRGHRIGVAAKPLVTGYGHCCLP